MAQKQRILFICTHNSGRSQMAEAYAGRFYGDVLDVESAGLEPAEAVNPLVVSVMREEGIDLSGKKPRSVFEVFRSGRLFSYVITVCQDSDSRCPIFPGITTRWHWPFPDPAAVEGSEAEKLEKVRKIRDAIKEWVLGKLRDL